MRLAVCGQIGRRSEGSHQTPTRRTDDTPWHVARAVLDAITTSHALVELPNVSGVNFTHEDGTPYTPDELRYFAGEAIAAAESGSTTPETKEN